jgi:ubiquinone/menaquinone biosynthesis C-methylase UbiE
MDSGELAIPNYLARTYWWAYVHPRAIRLFERQWLVNLILWGNFARLRDHAIDALGGRLDGRTLQIACVYGDLTARLAGRIPRGAGLDVVDVLPLQLQNLSRKLSSSPEAATLICGDSAALRAADASYDRALLFFLLHEQPAEVRRRTLAEAMRVVKPGGRIVVVDYHRPHALHPLRLPMRAILGTLEPYALDLWRHELAHWLPPERALSAMTKRTFFGGLYQLLTFTRGESPELPPQASVIPESA